MEIKRKIASIRKIDRIDPIPEADAIECAYVGGWPVVVKKNEYKAGDLAIYFEIDSFIPHVLAPFLSKGKEPRVYNGIKGERLRTVRLRNQISQGLLLPVDWQDTQPFITANFLEDGIGSMLFVNEGDDVTEALGIQKWEAPVPAELAGQVEGVFPLFIPKTDQERIQNLVEELEFHRDDEFEITQKLDGSSMTVFFKFEEAGPAYHIGVCSRNFELKINEENKNNSFIRLATDSNLLDALAILQMEVAIQGELIGPGIQGNPEKLEHTMMYIFDIYDIKEKRYLREDERKRIMYVLYMNGCDKERVFPCPTIERRMKIDDMSVADLLKMAEGLSAINKSAQREGLVFKSQTSDFSFKCISNKWLLSKKD